MSIRRAFEDIITFLESQGAYLTISIQSHVLKNKLEYLATSNEAFIFNTDSFPRC